MMEQGGQLTPSDYTKVRLEPIHVGNGWARDHAQPLYFSALRLCVRLLMPVHSLPASTRARDCYVTHNCYIHGYMCLDTG